MARSALRELRSVLIALDTLLHALAPHHLSLAFLRSPTDLFLFFFFIFPSPLSKIICIQQGVQYARALLMYYYANDIYNKLLLLL